MSNMSETYEAVRGLSAQSDSVDGENGPNWQEAAGEVPNEVVADWFDRPFKERTDENLVYWVQVKTELDENKRILISEVRLTSGMQTDPEDIERALQWDWVLKLRGEETATLSAFEWNCRITDEGNSGSRSDYLTREATIVDLKMFARFLGFMPPITEGIS